MPLSAEGCAARRTRLLDSVEVDMVVISDPRHIFYLTGLYSSPNTLNSYGQNYLLIDDHSGESLLLAHDFAFLGQPPDSVHVDEVEVWRWYDGKQAATSMYPESFRQLNERLSMLSARRIGMEVGQFPYGIDADEVIDVTDILLTMRRQKDADELDMIREAIMAVESGHAAIREDIEAGLTELDIYNIAYEAIVSAAGRPVVPMGDFVSGERASQGGGPPTDRVLQPGEAILCDIFCIVNGYRADISATYPVNGMTDTMRDLQDVLHAALSAGEAMLKPGARAADVYGAVKAAIDERGYGENFNTHAGHGLGLGHPEAPYLVPDTDEVLFEGDVLTLEPGAYGEGFGARIEHNYLITEEGFYRLSNHQTGF